VSTCLVLISVDNAHPRESFHPPLFLVAIVNILAHWVGATPPARQIFVSRLSASLTLLRALFGRKNSPIRQYV
jgi:hypothetical protein